MFGHALRIVIDGFGVTMRPPKKGEMESIAESFSSMEVQRYLNMCYPVTPEDETDWWEKARKQPDSVLWSIVPDGSETIIGNTGLHGIHPLWGCCMSGIGIDKPYWGKGIAYRCHLIRTWYAVKHLNRVSIQSGVRAPNVASLKALLKVGYRLSGQYDMNVYRDGIYMNTYLLSWLNPYMTKIMFPQGVPEEYKDSLEKAKLAIELAEKSIILL